MLLEAKMMRVVDKIQSQLGPDLVSNGPESKVFRCRMPIQFSPNPDNVQVPPPDREASDSK